MPEINTVFVVVTMRRLILPVLACCLICCADADSAFSQGGRGRGGGNGGGRSAARGGGPRGNNGNRPAITQQNRGGANRATSPGRPDHARSRATGQNRAGRSTTGTDTADPTARLTGRDHALDIQRRNEERKLEHRLQTADHLRENAARNGNQNLLDTADRMEQRAYEHYESRLSRINGDPIDPDHLPDDLNQLADLADGDAAEQLETVGDQLLDNSDVTDVLDGGADSLTRRLANEERKLQHQLDVAQQLRDIAARNGNENLVQTAERMEEMAVTRYERQLEKFNLSDLESEALTDPLDVLPE